MAKLLILYAVKMIKLLNALLLFYNKTSYCSPINEDTELALAFLVHRHGDRTVLAASLSYSTNPEEVRRLSEPYGFGQLTNAGIQRAYEVGKFIRQRYNDVLSPKFNKSEIYIRSTDSTRTEMSILAAMAAVYGSDSLRWHPTLKWSPTPYTTVPANIDYNLAAINCPVFSNHYIGTMNYNTPKMAEFSDLFEELAQFWYDFRKTPARILEGYDTLIAQLGLGVPLGPKLENVFLKVKEAALKSWNIIYGKEKFLNLLSGVLLKSFLDSANKTIAGVPTEKVRILSGHDFSVYPFLLATQASPLPGIPKYCSLYGLELRRVLNTRKYVVVPYYLSQPNEEVQYLRIRGCGEGLCDLEKFQQLTAKYVLSENEWRTKCNITDGVVDTSVIAK